MAKETIQNILTGASVILAALIATVLGYYGNLRVKRFEIEVQSRKEEANQRLRFYLPLLRFCDALDRRIGHILTKIDTDWLSKTYLEKIHKKEGFACNPDEKGYFISSSTYIFACFFGWSEAIKRGIASTSQVSESGRLSRWLSRAKRRFLNKLGIADERGAFLFDPDISVVSKLFQYEELFSDYMVSKTLKEPRDASKLHKQFQYSIGELMIERDGQENYRCKSFREFFNAYVEDKGFRYWFVPLENLLSDLSDFEKGKDIETQVQMKNDIRPLRLLAIRYWCRVLMKNMGRELNIQTRPPDEVLYGISASLTKTIKSVEIDKLESYLLGVRIHHE